MKFFVLATLVAAASAEAWWGASPYAVSPYWAGSAYGAVPYAAAYAPLSYSGNDIRGNAVHSTPSIVGASGEINLGQTSVAGVGSVRRLKREADAEADPALLYNTVGYPYASAVNTWGYSNLGYNAWSPYTVASSVYQPAVTYANRLWKREAEADSEADPALLYNTVGYPYAANWAGYSNLAYNAWSPYTAAASVYSPALRYGAVNVNRLWKREAEAEADPALVYNTAGYPYASTWGSVVRPAAYSWPYATTAAYSTPLAYRQWW